MHMIQFGIITASPKVKHVLKIIESISNTSTTVLLTGETGTGKELIAQAIHQNRTRSHKPFVAIKIDVRFIAATNVNVQEEVRKGTFREDLYYRLNVLPIEIPPLRERREDIPLLVRHYISEYGKKYNKRIAGITDKAMDVLTKHSWFGNVRELQNLSEMLVVLATEGSKIDEDFLPETLFKSNVNEPAGTYEEVMKAFEKEYLIKVLQETNWNRTEASKKMGFHRNTLQNKMREHGLKEAH